MSGRPRTPHRKARPLAWHEMRHTVDAFLACYPARVFPGTDATYVSTVLRHLRAAQREWEAAANAHPKGGHP